MYFRCVILKVKREVSREIPRSNHKYCYQQGKELQDSVEGRLLQFSVLKYYYHGEAVSEIMKKKIMLLYSQFLMYMEMGVYVG